MPPEDSTPSNYEYSSDDAGSSDATGKSSSPGLGSGASGSAAASNRKPLDLQRAPNRESPSRSGLSSRGSSSAGLPSSDSRSSVLSSSGLPSSGLQGDVDQLVRQALRDLEGRRRDLQREVEQLERRKERLAAEMKTSFAGSSQDIAIRVQGFKDYLIGSLQDLVTAAEDMDFAPPRQQPAESPRAEAAPVSPGSQGGYSGGQGGYSGGAQSDDMVPLAAQRFAQQRDRINSLLDQYRTRPDYYGPPWQLRRTFEPIHADRASNWFFTQGGRGSVKSMGSRLQNVLVASAAISCMHAIYDNRLCVLVLATTPERLGEWRRWLQDCLGIARSDFGTNRGVMLFEASEPMAQRAERLLDSGRIPFLIMDEAEEKVSLSLLQYPLWMGFAPDPANPSSDYDYY